MGYLLAIDTETPNPWNDRICGFGWAKILDRKIVERGAVLLDPECLFSGNYVLMHHISEEMVQGLPNFKAFWPDFESLFYGADAVMAHVAGFHLDVLSKCMRAYGFKGRVMTFIDTLHVARATLKSRPSFALSALAEEFGIAHAPHDPQSDAETCASVFLALTKDQPDLERYLYDYDLSGCLEIRRRRDWIPPKSWGELTEYWALLAGIAAKTSVERADFKPLEDWLACHEDCKKKFPCRVIDKALQTWAKRGEGDPSAMEWILDLCKRCFDPLYGTPQSEQIALKNALFCFTADIRKGDRLQIWDRIHKKGGCARLRIARNIRYLVLGAFSLLDWQKNELDPFVKRILEFQAQGEAIDFISEEALLERLEKKSKIQKLVFHHGKLIQKSDEED